MMRGYMRRLRQRDPEDGRERQREKNARTPRLGRPSTWDRAKVAEQHEIAKAAATRAQQPWTDVDTEVLMSSATNFQAALALGRKIDEVDYRRKQLRRIGEVRQGYRYWTADEDRRLAEMCDLPSREVAEALGRTRQAVTARRKHLRRQGLIPTGGQR